MLHRPYRGLQVSKKFSSFKNGKNVPNSTFGSWAAPKFVFILSKLSVWQLISVLPRENLQVNGRRILQKTGPLTNICLHKTERGFLLLFHTFVPWISLLAVGLSATRSNFDTRPVLVKSVVEKLTVGKFFIENFALPSISIIPLSTTLHTPSLSNWQRLQSLCSLRLISVRNTSVSSAGSRIFIVYKNLYINYDMFRPYSVILRRYRFQ